MKIKLNLNSPVEELESEFFKQKNIKVFLKRDDLIHPFISGNKWRKLKYIIKDAQRNNCTRLVTFGGAYSNHLLATACAAAMLKFKSAGIVRGDEHKSGSKNNSLFLCEQFGMELIYVSRKEYKDKDKLFAELYGSDREAYYIPEGGYSTFALKGCGEIVDELSEVYDHIFTACGTATTLSGIAKRIADKKLPTKIEGIAALKGAEFLNRNIKNLIGPNIKYKLHTEFHLGGFAKTNTDYLDWLKKFNSCGILLDHVYTGKMIRAVFHLAERNYFKNNARILALHTGGLIGLLGINR